jgi:hypothetical protein
MRSAPLCFCQQGMTCRARVEAIASIHVFGVKPDIIDVSIPGIRPQARCAVFVQHIAQDRNIGITDNTVIISAVPEGVCADAATIPWACVAKSTISAPLMAWLNNGSRLALFS